jgi:ABC-type oligopeptide transport system substrate-binding subunit
MKKKVSLIILAAAPLALCACNSSTSISSTLSSTGASSISWSSESGAFDAATYAGYEVDLDGDGTVSDSEKGLTWSESYDAIIAKIKSTTDADTRYKLMHNAETELMSTGAVTPLYYYTDLFLKKETLTGFFSSPLGFKIFTDASNGDTRTMTAALASAPSTIDPALNTTVDGGTYDMHLFEGLYRWSYTGTYPDGTISLVPGIASGAPTEVTNTDGTVTYTFTLRSDLKWSDGTSYDATDVVRSWKRAVSSDLAADYCYLFEVIKGGADAEGEADGASLDVVATDANTLQVTLVNEVPYFDELLAFPAFSPVPESADLAGAWAAPANASTFVSNGPMMIKSYNSTALEVEANPNYYDSSRSEGLDVTFAFSDDAEAMLNSYESGSYTLIDDFPTEDIASLKSSIPNEFFDVGQLGTYYLSWNVNDRTFDTVANTEEKREYFRTALSLLINRQYLVDSVTQGGQTPADGFVSNGLTGPNGTGEYVDSNGPDQDGSGWYDTSSSAYAANVATAVSYLKQIGYTYDESTGKFTDIPSFTYLYNSSSSHQAIAEYIQGIFSQYGITMTLESQEWATFVSTRSSGDYTLARDGWLCDYNDPISMLDMFTSQSGNNDPQFGKSAS